MIVKDVVVLDTKNSKRYSYPLEEVKNAIYDYSFLVKHCLAFGEYRQDFYVPNISPDNISHRVLDVRFDIVTGHITADIEVLEETQFGKLLLQDGIENIAFTMNCVGEATTNGEVSNLKILTISAHLKE